MMLQDAEFCFHSEGIIFVYDDQTHQVVAGDGNSSDVVRVSNIDPVPGDRVRFKITWHSDIVPMLDDEVLVKEFASRREAERFEQSILHTLMTTETGRSKLAHVRAKEIKQRAPVSSSVVQWNARRRCTVGSSNGAVVAV